jgi:hypothetical protein
VARIFGLLIAVLLLAGCGTTRTAAGVTTSFDPSAAAPCERSEYASRRVMVAAFSSTAAAVVRWQETRHGPTGPQPISRFRSWSPNDVIHVCYFDGFYPKAPPLPLNGTPPPPFDRIVVLVAQGMDELDSAGYQHRINIVRP